jgi:hypothetical protein
MRAFLRPCAAAAIVALCLAAAGPAAAEPAGQAVPCPAALDSAAVVEDRLDDVGPRALVLGNGDLNALLFSQGDALVMRVTKNDVWDHRIDTSEDPPLCKIDVKNHTWASGASKVPSWHGRPYPVPRVCAIVRLGAAAAQTWHPVRAQGSKNTWALRDGLAVMAVEGKAGASSGWRCEFPELSSDQYGRLKLRLSGSGAARYFVDLLASDGKEIVHSGWIDTPREEAEKVFPLPAAVKFSRLDLYAMTADGKLAENRYREVALDGPGGTVALDLKSAGAAAAAWTARLDLRRAVAHIARAGNPAAPTTVRTLAQQNVFLIECDRPGSLAPVPAGYLPAAEEGETEGVKWVKQHLPGDPDYGGMDVVTALGESGRRKAVAVVTSLESKDAMGDALRLVRETLSADAAALVRDHEQVWQRFWAAGGVELADPEVQNWWYRMLYYMRCFARPGAWAVGCYAGLANDKPGWHSGYTFDYNVEQTFWTPFACNRMEMAEPYVHLITHYLPRAQWMARQTYDCGGAFYPINMFGIDNCPTDIAYIRLVCRAVMESSRVLGRDADLAERCRRLLALLPDYPTAEAEGGTIVVDWQGCKATDVRVHNVTVPAIPVFPAEQVTWFSPESEKALFVRTINALRHNGNNANVMLNVARARLSLPAAYEETRTWFTGKATPNGMFAWLGHGYYLSESSAVSGLVAELLMQSVGDVIRLFPAWPKDKAAKFTSLRAQGGFLVSAEQADGKCTRLEITSTVGGRLQLVSPWAAINVRRAGGETALRPDARGIVALDTQAGERLEFVCATEAKP